MNYKEEAKKYRRYERMEEISKESMKYAHKDLPMDDKINLAVIGGFNMGASWSDENPSTETILHIFEMFDKHGLIKEDLCFDPEHFIKTVIKPNF